jgi:hypothetical protein
MAAPKPQQDAPAPASAPTAEAGEERSRTLTCEATATEARELAMAAAVEMMARGPWLLQAALKEARKVNAAWAAERAAADDGA